MSLFTSKIVMPEALNDSISSFFEESGPAVAGRTRAKVGCPSWALALVTNVPMCPVAPTTKILLIPIVSRLLWWEDQDENWKALKIKIQLSEGSLKQRPIF